MDLATNNQSRALPHRRSSSSSNNSAISGTVNPSYTPDVTDTSSASEDHERNLIPNVGELIPSPVSILWAMCVLRIKRLVRNYVSFFFLIFMPVILVASGFAIVKLQSISVQEHKLTFSISDGMNCQN
jgi:hypothetical protein